MMLTSSFSCPSYVAAVQREHSGVPPGICLSLTLRSQWDSYFISLGLITDGHIELAKGIVDHFRYEIQHYGKILNGNRR